MDGDGSPREVFMFRAKISKTENVVMVGMRYQNVVYVRETGSRPLKRKIGPAIE